MEGAEVARFVWFDGRFVRRERALVPVTTHAIHYGTSAFEGIRAYWNSGQLSVFRLGDHVRRLRRSARRYSMRLRFTDAQVAEAVTGLCRKNRIREPCYVRPFCFVGRHGISLDVTGAAETHAAAFAFPMGRLFGGGGISAVVSRWRKFSDATTPTQAKMGGNYLNSIIATRDARRRGADEAILLDSGSGGECVSEAPGENVFIVKGGRLATPPLSSSALDGITRDTVLRIAKDSGRRAEVRRITRRQLRGADEAFLTGTAAEITPITRIDGAKVGDGKVGEATAAVMGAYSDIVNGRDRRYARWLTGVY